MIHTVILDSERETPPVRKLTRNIETIDCVLFQSHAIRWGRMQARKDEAI